MIQKTSSYEKCACPATGIREDSKLEEYDWGCLYVYTDGRLPEFLTIERPSEREIRDRWGYYLTL